MTSFPSELREPKGLLPPWLAALVRIHSRTYLKGGILLLCIHFICINVRCWNLVECFSLVRASTPLSHCSVTDWFLQSLVPGMYESSQQGGADHWWLHWLFQSGLLTSCRTLAAQSFWEKQKKITGGLKHQCRKMWQARSGWLRERGGVTGRATGGWETHFQEKPPLEKRSPGGQVRHLHPFPACMASLCYPWSSGAPIPALSTCLPLPLLP